MTAIMVPVLIASYSLLSQDQIWAQSHFTAHWLCPGTIYLCYIFSTQDNMAGFDLLYRSQNPPPICGLYQYQQRLLFYLGRSSTLSRQNQKHIESSSSKWNQFDQVTLFYLYCFLAYWMIDYSFRISILVIPYFQQPLSQ